jgi:hypothetical protein
MPRWHWIVRPRIGSGKRGSSGFLSPLGVSGFDGILVYFVFAAFLILMLFLIFVGLPLLIFLVEALLIIPATIFFGVLGRLFLGRPWSLEASTAGPPPEQVAWSVVGWTASERAVSQMAGVLKATGDLPPAVPQGERRARVRR